MEQPIAHERDTGQYRLDGKILAAFQSNRLVIVQGNTLYKIKDSGLDSFIGENRGDIPTITGIDHDCEHIVHVAIEKEGPRRLKPISLNKPPEWILNKSDDWMSNKIISSFEYKGKNYLTTSENKGYSLIGENGNVTAKKLGRMGCANSTGNKLVIGTPDGQIIEYTGDSESSPIISDGVRSLTNILFEDGQTYVSTGESLYMLIHGEKPKLVTDLELPSHVLKHDGVLYVAGETGINSIKDGEVKKSLRVPWHDGTKLLFFGRLNDDKADDEALAVFGMSNGDFYSIEFGELAKMDGAYSIGPADGMFNHIKQIKLRMSLSEIVNDDRQRSRADTMFNPVLL
tara:strand:+ start:1173 stop:2201 length:1029 start_codon:yes stop_codon:yes gene_type:complete